MRKRTTRRKFIQQTGTLTAAATLMQSGWTSLFAKEYKQYPIAADKGLSKAYIQSLYERGNATTYLKTKNELTYIGMPVGGIGCGTVYAGGDGRLWLWDIFNRNQEGVDPKVVEWQIFNQPKQKVRSRDGACYVEPAKDIRPLLQEFAIQIKYKGIVAVKLLHESDWDEIKFEATYPVAKVHYIQNDLPFSITAELYSPFIPLDEDNSGLPATIIDFHIINKSGTDAEVSVLSMLENKTAPYTAKPGAHARINEWRNEDKLQAIYMYTKNADGTIKQDGNNDDGNMTIACLQNATANTDAQWPLTATSFDSAETDISFEGAGKSTYGSLCHTINVKHNQSVKTSFVIAWYFPNVNLKKRFKSLEGDGAYYTRKHASSFDVAKYIAGNYSYLSEQTKLWQRTWYENSTLPHWFLERTFLNISTLATATTKRFESGRFWGWEGVGACEGTCTHVWQYAQAAGRIFPSLERNVRENVDLDTSIAMQQGGGIKFRGELETRPAVDGQAGTILRIYREHQMSKDNAFLQKNWQAIKKAVTYIFSLDKNDDGMEDAPVENTLDAMWDGEIAWIVGLCIAAVQAAQLMAKEMNDPAFAEKCSAYVANGRKNMETQLYNGEYFIHRPDEKKGRSALGSYNTCHIDQVFGQSWAFQLGMPRVLDKQKTQSALKALWKYNFATDVGPYLQQVGVGRPYALPGEGGMIMNTNPKNEPKPYGDNVTWQLGYFHECMSGFEHQVASHMMAEGMKDEAMVITRAIHDRYHAKKRNPFNEIECSDHYARAMASYGTFITACGFEYHGPKGYIRFAPQWKKEKFAAPFTAASGWGTYSQQQQVNKQVHTLAVNYGLLTLSSICLQCFAIQKATKVIVSIDKQLLPATLAHSGNDVIVKLAEACTIPAGKQLVITIS